MLMKIFLAQEIITALKLSKDWTMQQSPLNAHYVNLSACQILKDKFVTLAESAH
jgi:hypothetical protein